MTHLGHLVSIVVLPRTTEGVYRIGSSPTRECPGSPNIPATILRKIESADIFLSDVTTIARGGPNDRPVANPNVLFELGYAVSHLGWDRVLLLFNTAHGKFPDDAPFDIDRHRASPYEFAYDSAALKKMPRKQRDAAKRPLQDLIYTALKQILESDPQKPRETVSLDPTARERQHDVTVLRDVLERIHIPTIDAHLRDAPYKIDEDIFGFAEDLLAVVQGSLFHFYDPVLAKLVPEFCATLNHSLSFGEQYHAGYGAHTYHYFSNPGDMPLNERQQAAWDKIEELLKACAESLASILTHVRAEYLELNPDKLSEIAWERYIAFKRDVERRIRGDEGSEDEAAG